jgi:2-oxoglutarate dehydrogenase E1 component
MGPKMQEVADALRLDTELSADSAAYIEELYEQYLTSPTSVSEDWREYFDKYPKGDQPHGSVREQFLLLGRNSSRIQPVVQSAVSTEHERRQIGVLQLIAAYRNRGHQKAKLDPLGLAKREDVPDLDLSAHGLTKSDLDTVFNTGNLAIGKAEATLSEMIEAWKQFTVPQSVQNTCISSTLKKNVGFNSVWKVLVVNLISADQKKGF